MSSTKMVSPKNVNWTKIINPSPSFKLFIPQEDKLKALEHELLTRELWLEDEYRTQPQVQNMLCSNYSLYALNLQYEVGDFQGIINFRNILPGHKCSVSFKIIDKELFKPSFVKEGKRLLKLIMKEFHLERIHTFTADEIMVKLAEMFGFKKEGILRKNFKWNGKLYDEYIMGLLKEDM